MAKGKAAAEKLCLELQTTPPAKDVPVVSSLRKASNSGKIACTLEEIATFADETNSQTLTIEITCVEDCLDSCQPKCSKHQSLFYANFFNDVVDECKKLQPRGVSLTLHGGFDETLCTLLRDWTEKKQVHDHLGPKLIILLDCMKLDMGTLPILLYGQTTVLTMNNESNTNDNIKNLLKNIFEDAELKCLKEKSMQAVCHSKLDPELSRLVVRKLETSCGDMFDCLTVHTDPLASLFKLHEAVVFLRTEHQEMEEQLDRLNRSLTAATVTILKAIRSDSTATKDTSRWLLRKIEQAKCGNDLVSHLHVTRLIAESLAVPPVASLEDKQGVLDFKELKKFNVAEYFDHGVHPFAFSCLSYVFFFSFLQVFFFSWLHGTHVSLAFNMVLLWFVGLAVCGLCQFFAQGSDSNRKTRSFFESVLLCFGLFNFFFRLFFPQEEAVYTVWFSVVNALLSLRLLLLLSAFTHFAIVIRAILLMMRDIIMFVIIYLVILFAFACIFVGYFRAYPTDVDLGFNNFSSTLVTLFTATFGGFDLADLVTRDLMFPSLLLIVYLVVGPILLINLLIALMNSSYSDALSAGRAVVNRTRIGLLISSEDPLTFKLLSLPPPFNLIRVSLLLLMHMIKMMAKCNDQKQQSEPKIIPLLQRLDYCLLNIMIFPVYICPLYAVQYLRRALSKGVCCGVGLLLYLIFVGPFLMCWYLLNLCVKQEPFDDFMNRDCKRATNGEYSSVKVKQQIVFYLRQLQNGYQDSQAAAN